MKTKIVYVVTSSDQDLFLEQCWLSAYSGKIFMPDCHITILTDVDTYDNILSSDRKEILKVVDEIIPINIPSEFSKMERSRWLKTSMRKHIKGDFIYIDCDTIICADLSEVDNLNCNVGGIIDRNVPLKDNKSLFLIKKRLKKAFGIKINLENHYINSGVLYVKDNDQAKKFFEIWHSNWLISLDNGVRIDQPALYKSELEAEEIKELDGIWNAQIEGSLKYFYDAKILHFFSKHGGDKLVQFFDCEPYKQIKIDRGVSEHIAQRVRHFKRYFFSSDSIIIFGKNINIFTGKAFCKIKNNMFLSLIRLIVK